MSSHATNSAQEHIEPIRLGWEIGPDEKLSRQSKYTLAKEHIERIRLGWEIGPDGKLSRQSKYYTLAKDHLNLLSTQLNKEKQHFLYEVFQNADDLVYPPNVPPTLQLNLYEEVPRLEILSIERGFEPEDVAAICDAAQSTKARKANTIGEKGIGFKSVFAVAYKVRIRSKAYLFELDTSNPAFQQLGMIIPTWIPYQLSEMPEYGSVITLHLRDSSLWQTLRDHLCNVDFSFLLFCNRLRTIAATFHPANGFSSILTQGCTTFSTNIQRSTTIKDNKVFVVDHFVHEFMVEYMPKEEKRPGVPQTKIKMAFPYQDFPIVMSQQTYAFLPVQSFGFQFLLHADFILNASRDGIDERLQWNEKLRANVPEALAEACQAMTQNSVILRFQWPQYLYGLSALLRPSFFESVGEQCLKRLATQHVIVAEDDTSLTTPSNALIVGPMFRDERNQPLLSSAELGKMIISDKYPESSLFGLGSIGVVRLNHDDLANALLRFVKRKSLQFQGQPDSWHDAIAKVFYERLRSLKGSGRLFRELRSILRKISLVTLCGGRWTSLENEDVSIQSDSMSHIRIPKGLNISIAETTDPTSWRLRLYQILGAETCTPDHICHKILLLHGDGEYLDRSTCIEQTVFLFEMQYQPSLTRNELIFFSDEGHRKKKSTGPLFVQYGATGRQFSEILPEGCEVIRRLHPDYETAVADTRSEEWHEWLCSWPSLSNRPNFHEAGELSAASIYVYERHGSVSLLSFLRLCEPNLEQLRALSQDRCPSWIRQMCTTEVCTTKGGKARLAECALPSLEAKFNKDEHSVPYVLLKAIRNEYWKGLDIFQVTTTANVYFHLRRLQYLKKAHNSNATIPTHQIQQIYKDIQKHIDSANKDIENAFIENELVFVDAAWYSPRQCVWRADFDCTVCPVLHGTYKGCAKLFRTSLNIKNADVDTIIREFSHRETQTKSSDGESERQLLLALDQLFRKCEPTVEQIKELFELEIFPVEGKEGDDPNWWMATVKEWFYLADREALRSAFRGKVKLLKASVEDVVINFQHVIEYLKLSAYRLSVRVIEEREAVIKRNPIEVLTEKLKKRRAYILGVLVKYRQDISRDVLLDIDAQLKNVNCFGVDRIGIRRTIHDDDLEDGDDLVVGKPKNGRVVLEQPVQETGLDVLIARSPQGYDSCRTELASLLADHFGIAEDAKEARPMLQQVIVCDDLPYLLDSVFLPNKIRLIKYVAKEAGSNRRYSAEGNQESDEEEDASEESDQDSVEEEQNIDRLQTGVEEQEESEADARQSRTTDDHRHQPSSRNRTSSGSELEEDSLPTDETIAQTIQTSRFTDVTPILPIEKQLDLSGLSLNAPDAHPSEGTLLSPRDGITSSHRKSSSTGSHDAGGTLDDSEGFVSDSPEAAFVAVSPKPTPRRHDRISGPRFSSGRARRSARDEYVADDSDSENGPTRALSMKIGYAGELFMYEFLLSLLTPPVFTVENWTSAMRTRRFPNHAFMGHEAEFSDFSFVDGPGRFRRYLATRCEGLPRVNAATVWHVEVKSTTERVGEPWYLSGNQVGMAFRWSALSLPLRGLGLAGEAEGGGIGGGDGVGREGAVARDVYVVARVFNVSLGGVGSGGEEKEAKVLFLVDPVRLVCQGRLAWEVLGKIAVRVLGNGEEDVQEGEEDGGGREIW